MSWKASIKQSVLAEVRLEESKRQVAQIDSMRKAMEAKDEMLRVQRQEIINKRAELSRREQAAAKATASAAADLRKELTVVQQIKLDSIISGYEHQLALKDQQIEQAEAMNRLTMGQVAVRDTMLESMRRVNSELLKKLEAETKRNKPSVFDKVVKYAGWGVALVVAVK